MMKVTVRYFVSGNHKVDCTHSDHLSFGFAGLDRIITFKVSFADFSLPLWTTELNCP